MSSAFLWGTLYAGSTAPRGLSVADVFEAAVRRIEARGARVPDPVAVRVSHWASDPSPADRTPTRASALPATIERCWQGRLKTPCSSPAKPPTATTRAACTVHGGRACARRGKFWVKPESARSLQRRGAGASRTSCNAAHHETMRPLQRGMTIRSDGSHPCRPLASAGPGTRRSPVATTALPPRSS